MAREDLTGKTIGVVQVLERAQNSKSGHAMYSCLCKNCGRVFTTRSAALMCGDIYSCGCMRNERATAGSVKVITKHGETTHHGFTRLYRIWQAMKRRCDYEKNSNFKYYGGRGIAVCDEWQHDFASFRDWALSNGYKEDLSIDRIDVNGNYCPENCRWVSMAEQQRNKRNNK